MWYLEYTTREDEEVDWDDGDGYFFVLDDEDDEIDFEDI